MQEDDTRAQRYNGANKDNDVIFGVSDSSSSEIGDSEVEDAVNTYFVEDEERRSRSLSIMLSNNNAGHELQDESEEEKNEAPPVGLDIESFGSLFDNYQPISTPQSGRVVSV